MTHKFVQRLNNITTDEESAGESSDEYTDSAEEESDEDQEEQIHFETKSFGEKRRKWKGDCEFQYLVHFQAKSRKELCHFLRI